MKWETSRANMCSYMHTPAEVVALHAKHCQYYNATSNDVELVDNREDPHKHLPRQPKSHYSLIIKSYRGWKVYNLHCGAFVYRAEYKELEEQFLKEEREAGRLTDTE